jgi:hypothetical protein
MTVQDNKHDSWTDFCSTIKELNENGFEEFIVVNF